MIFFAIAAAAAGVFQDQQHLNQLSPEERHIELYRRQLAAEQQRAWDRNNPPSVQQQQTSQTDLSTAFCYGVILAEIFK
jgi:hypothetical protein